MQGTDVLIKRELLELLIGSAMFGLGVDNSDIAAAKAILAAPQPSAVQGEAHMLRTKLGEVSRLAGNALRSIGGIRQGQNVTPDELWQACGYLDAAIAAARQEGGKV